MTLRPQAARWFEVIAARDDAYLALEALATAGCVEIEWHAADAQTPAPGSAAARLREYTTLARRYARYWPPAELRLNADPRAPADALAAGLAVLDGWARDAEPLIAELQHSEAARNELALADQALVALADSSLDFALLAQAQHGGGDAVGVATALFALPLDATVPVPDDVLTRQATVDNETLLLAVGPPAAIEAMSRSVTEANGRRARFPDWLQPSAAASRSELAQRHGALAGRAQDISAQLDRLSAQHGIARALGDIARATWCFEHGGAISLGDKEHGDVFARLTGWATDADRLIAALEASPARALVTFPPAPRGARAPLVLANPWWARPFEVFPRLVGMPGASGADPSALLAFAVPLMFGYMFGDIGQGLVLAAVGLWLSKRLPVLRLLVPGGLAAAFFGWVFGSVFSIEHLIPPLWLHPLAHPLPVLVVPVIAGAVLLTLGLLLELLQRWWQQQTAHWLREDLPVLVVYLGVLTGLLTPIGWLVAAAGALLAMGLAAQQAITQRAAAPVRPVLTAVGAARAPAPAARGPIAAALGALGQLVEHVLQVLINTLSFARVGAFALAHAGLSSAVVSLAQAVDHPAGYALVLVLGNVLIIAIEGLVVSIQTTRLVLFEFFTRFFKAEGREFRPLIPPPPHLASGELVLTKEK
jgi:V/A-type H+-transporting ATPase subunit I